MFAPIILGRPFLKFNSISINNENDDIIHNPTGIDSTNIIIPSATVEPLTPTPICSQIEEEQEKENQRRIRDLGKELKEKFGNKG